MVIKRRKRKVKSRKVFSVLELTPSKQVAGKFFKNRKIRGSKIIGLRKKGEGTEVFFTK